MANPFKLKDRVRFTTAWFKNVTGTVVELRKDGSAWVACDLTWEMWPTGEGRPPWPETDDQHRPLMIVYRDWCEIEIEPRASRVRKPRCRVAKNEPTPLVSPSGVEQSGSSSGS